MLTPFQTPALKIAAQNKSAAPRGNFPQGTTHFLVPQNIYFLSAAFSQIPFLSAIVLCEDIFYI